MPIRTILVPFWPGSEAGHQLDAALLLARRMGAHIEAVFVQLDPALAAAALPGIGGTMNALAERIEGDGREALRTARRRFEDWRLHHNLPDAPDGGMTRSTFTRWFERVGLPERVVVHKGRLSDLIVLNFPAPGGPLDRVFDAALFETGRPVLLVPGRPPDSLLRHVVVAWNGSLEATRAVAAALPLLHEAEAVSVLVTPGLADRAFANDPYLDDLDLAEALEWHGVRARRCRVAADDEAGAGAALLRAAQEREASLLVMGSFTHGRAAGAVLGGVTRHVLGNPVLPVLMAH